MPCSYCNGVMKNPYYGTTVYFVDYDTLTHVVSFIPRGTSALYAVDLDHVSDVCARYSSSPIRGTTGVLVLSEDYRNRHSIGRSGDPKHPQDAGKPPVSRDYLGTLTAEHLHVLTLGKDGAPIPRFTVVEETDHHGNKKKRKKSDPFVLRIDDGDNTAKPTLKPILDGGGDDTQLNFGQLAEPFLGWTKTDLQTRIVSPKPAALTDEDAAALAGTVFVFQRSVEFKTLVRVKQQTRDKAEVNGTSVEARGVAKLKDEHEVIPPGFEKLSLDLTDHTHVDVRATEYPMVSVTDYDPKGGKPKEPRRFLPTTGVRVSVNEASFGS